MENFAVDSCEASRMSSKEQVFAFAIGSSLAESLTGLAEHHSAKTA